MVIVNVLHITETFSLDDAGVRKMKYLQHIDEGRKGKKE